MGDRGLEGKMKKIGKKSEVQEISDKEFDSVIKKNPVVVVDFYAEWCMPCVMMAPVVDELALNYAGKITFAKINIEENKETPSKFKVMSIPTLLVFKKGENVDRIVGMTQYDALNEKLKKYLS